MPLYASAFFLPTSVSIPYLIEDVYIRGGFRTVTAIADRDAIKPASRKKGMMVYVQEDETLYWIPGPSTAGSAAWKPWDATKYVNFTLDNPLLLSENEETGERTLSIEPTRVVPVINPEDADYILLASAEGPVWARKLFLPDTTGAVQGNAVVLNEQGNVVWGTVDGLPDATGAATGDTVVLDATGKPVWGKASGLPDYSGATVGHALIIGADGVPTWAASNGLPDSQGAEAGSVITLDADGNPSWVPGSQLNPKRQTLSAPLQTIVVEGVATIPVNIPCATMTLLSVGLSHPDLLLEMHTTDAYNDANPYMFRSSLAKLEDDGLTIDGEATVKSRRYSIFSCPDPMHKVMYVKVTNEGLVGVDATLDLVFLPTEF